MPDALLPSQLLDDLTASAPETPERRLIAAVLLDALVQLSRRGSRAARDAEHWIRGEDAEDATAFSFASICDALGFDALHLARGMMRWRAAGGGSLPQRGTRAADPQVAPRHRRRSSVVHA